MNAPEISLNPHLEASLTRIRIAGEQAAERCAEGLALSALSSGQVKRRDTLLAAQFPGIAVGDCWDWSMINTGTGASDDATITVNTDHTIIGNPTVGALTDATIISGSARFRTRYTAANTFVTYRMA